MPNGGQSLNASGSAIRRLHRQFGHCPKKVSINLLRTAKIDKSYIDAANFHRCNQCEDAQPRRNAHTVSLPERYSFNHANHALGIDVFESLDARGVKYQVLNLVCLGTCFQLTEIVREGDGLPSSAPCLVADCPTVRPRTAQPRCASTVLCSTWNPGVTRSSGNSRSHRESGAARWRAEGDGEKSCDPNPGGWVRSTPNCLG